VKNERIKHTVALFQLSLFFASITMASQSLSDTMSSPSPFVYFLAGALVPSLAWILLRPKSKESNKSEKDEENDDEEDEDTAETTTDGMSSKWGYTDAPYKVSSVDMCLIYVASAGSCREISQVTMPISPRTHS
jgi:hypothetical protein